MSGLLGFAVAAAFWPGAMSAAIAPRWAVITLIVPVMLLALVARRRRHLTPADLVGMLLLAWATVSLSWTSNLHDGAGELLQWVFLAAVWCLGARMDLRRIVVGFGLGIWVSSAFAIAQWADEAHLEWLWPRMDGNAGLFVNQNTFAEAGALALVAAVGWRVWWLIPGIMPALIVTESRAAKAAVIVAGIAWLWSRSRWSTALLVVCGAGAIAALYALGYKHGSNVERLAILQDIWNGANFWGYGAGSFSTTFPSLATHIDTFTWRIEHAHNDFLEIALELGAPGLVLALGLVALAAFGASPARYVVIAFAVECALGFASHLPATAFLGVLCAGNACRAWRPVRELLDDCGVALQRRLAVAARRSQVSIYCEVRNARDRARPSQDH